MDPAPRTPTPQRLEWFGVTDRGLTRKNNEDAFLALQFDAREIRYLGKTGEAPIAPTDFVFAVSDGMGGANAGEVASRIAVEKIAHLLPRSFQQTAAGLAAGYDDVLAELFDRIHADLMSLGRSYAECRGMGATLSLTWFTPGWMYFAHIGDSRIYYLPAGESVPKQITEDDTHVGWLYRRGDINEREARTHPRRNLLQKALGAGHQFIDPQVGAVGYEAGDTFLLCTDGVIDGLDERRLAECLSAPESAENPAQYLVTTAIANSGRDNTTAVVVRAR
jgi:serine/threonine protein phosphatase PrpC